MKGPGFFPGCIGTINHDVNIKDVDVMVLGQDFDSLENYKKIDAKKGEIENNLSLLFYADSVVESKINLSKFNFYYLCNKRKFSMKNNEKQLNIFLLYYFPYGTAYDKLYNEIEEVYLNNINKTNLYIICVDPIYALKDE